MSGLNSTLRFDQSDLAEQLDALDDTIDYVLTLRMRRVKVKLRLLAVPRRAMQ